MNPFTKKNRQQDDANNVYDRSGTGYTYDGYNDGYDKNTFDGSMEDTAIDYTEAGTVEAQPERDLSRSTIKLMKFTTPKEREKVVECLRDGCAVIFELNGIDKSDWYRVIDYIQGALFVLGGTISRFSEYSLIAAPENYDISKLEIDDLDNDEDEPDDEEESDEDDAE